MSAPHPNRNMVVARLGTPDRTNGSLNDPRVSEENGFSFNEKWTYLHLTDDPVGVPTRIIYWMRYDFVGTVVRFTENESWRVDPALSEALAAEESSRLPALDPSHNPPITPASEYRPVSEFKGKPDLGGHMA
ncbi:MAG: hypothetical protein ABSD31_15365 [Candidatus Binataceae bacterium]|jgi:hypothetical protein